MKPLLIVKAGSTFAAIKTHFGDFEDWVIAACDSADAAFTVLDMLENPALPDVRGLGGVIITGSHAMVSDKTPWSLTLEQWIPHVLKHDIPMLGICFGHQILAEALGGLVAYHPGGREIGTVAINLTPAGRQDRLFGSMSDPCIAHTTHAQTVLRLPPRAQVLAHNAFESHHAFRVGELAWGVQFHPEFTAEIMRHYIREQADTLLKEDRNITALQSAVHPTDDANGLLKRFIRIVEENSELALD